MSVVSSIFNQAWQISAVQTMDDADYNQYVTDVYKTYFTFNVLVCTILICGSELIGKILFSGEYFVAWSYVPVLLVAILFSGLSGGMQPIFTARKRTLALFYSTMCGAILNLAMNFVFIPRYGVMAAAITTAVGFFAAFMVRDICVRKFFGIKLNGSREVALLGLLVAQAFTMCIPCALRYPLQAVSVVSVLAFCYKDIKKLIGKFLPKILTIVRRNKK